MNVSPLDRRRFLLRLASGLLVPALGRSAFADALERTPWATEGPFYPYRRLPLDRDNDLVVLGDSLTPAVGEITHLAGRILDTRGEPVKNARIEIWQCDSRGVYLAQGDAGGRADRNFQGWGRFETDSTGAYRFRTIKPVVYPGRSAPHIHVKVAARGRAPFTTQVFIKGHPGNLRDGVYREIGDAAARERLAVDFLPVAGSRTGELAARFDIVLGATPPG